MLQHWASWLLTQINYACDDYKQMLNCQNQSFYRYDKWILRLSAMEKEASGEDSAETNQLDDSITSK